MRSLIAHEWDAATTPLTPQTSPAQKNKPSYNCPANTPPQSDKLQMPTTPTLRTRHQALLLLTLLSLPALTRAQQPAAPTPDGILTLHTGTHLVVLDVTAVDWKGYPATGIKPEAFHLLEDGHEQTIKHFEEHAPIDPADARKRLAALARALPANTFTNLKPFPTSPTVNVVVMDTLTSRTDTQMNFHADLVAYMHSVPPGTPFILFRLDSQLRMVQELSMDPAVLLAAVTGKRFAIGDGPNTTPPQKRLIIGSAVDQLNKYLAGIPGRKTLLWFSGGLGIDLSLTGDRNDSTETDLFCKWTDDLQQHRIAAYRYLPERRFASGLGCSPGFTVGGSIAGVVESASHFYTLSYTPANAEWNGKYRKFKVNVTGRHGLTLDYRTGYYARTGDGSVSGETHIPLAPNPESTALQTAMGMGTVEPDDVIFEAVITPDPTVTKDPANAPSSPGNYLSETLRQQGYREHLIRFMVRANQLKLIPAPDLTAFAERLQVVAVLYNAQGQLVNSKKGTVAVTFDSPSDPRLETATLTADLTLQIPAKGTHFLRVGVRDTATDRVGALEIPVDRITPPAK
jgi:VWFA-related protein